MTAIVTGLVALAIWLYLSLCSVTLPSTAWAMRDVPNATTTRVVPHHWPPAGLSASNESRRVTPRTPEEITCSPHDISIKQKQMGATGIPRFTVSIVNTCPNHRCSIRNIIAFCGQFSSASYIDPNVFRRDGAGPNCIVNNMAPMTSGQMLTFDYHTEFLEPIRLSSAAVNCN